jgi:hypothetical protein
MPLEFRVRWQRDGRRAKTVIYQDWSAACQKMRSVSAIDAIKHDFPRIEEMPDLIGPPEFRSARSSEWRAHDYQPTATDRDRRRLHEHMRWTEETYSERAEPTPGEIPF